MLILFVNVVFGFFGGSGLICLDRDVQGVPF